MPQLRFSGWLLWAGATVFAAGAVHPQDYPGKPIRIVTSAAGGNNFATRSIAQMMVEHGIPIFQ